MKLHLAARALINSNALAHLVTLNEDGSPQVTVVWVGLDGDDVCQIAIEGLGPPLLPGIVHELRRDSQSIAGLPDAALEQVADTEEIADPWNGVIAVLEREGRGAGNNMEV